MAFFDCQRRKVIAIYGHSLESIGEDVWEIEEKDGEGCP